MSASRFSFFGASLLRHRINVSAIPAIRLSFSQSRFTCSAAVDTVPNDATDSRRHHPWPEWVTFVDRLKSKGYFSGALSPSADDTDMNFFKDACISFARDRFDVFKSLSRKDIQTVVEVGCPNLFRKSVNSAKRLRAYVQLDEGDVCSACNLRGSCDRAYIILKESEAAARTVDIMRILLFYALDPLVTSGEKPPGRELVEVSARKLLSELIELSESPLDPALPKPPVMLPHHKKLPMNFEADEMSQNIQRKGGGDWLCPKCDFLNFARNTRCKKCSEDGPEGVGMKEVEMKKGDWICPECNFMNFSRNIRCLRCKAEGPKCVNSDDIPMKKGDWNCPQCGFMNFASKTSCFRCREVRPKRQLLPGEWECPSCNFLNYRRNTVCLKCKCDRPKDTAKPYEEQ